MRGEYYCQFNSQLVTGGNNGEEDPHCVRVSVRVTYDVIHYNCVAIAAVID